MTKPATSLPALRDNDIAPYVGTIVGGRIWQMAKKKAAKDTSLPNGLTPAEQKKARKASIDKLLPDFENKRP